MDLLEILQNKKVNKPDIAVFDLSRAKWDAVAKPLNSLGKFEETVNRIAAIEGTTDVCLDKAILYVFAADNGVVEEGISQAGQDVTAICAKGIAAGRHSVAVMAKKAGVDVQVVDVGINADMSDNCGTCYEAEESGCDCDNACEPSSARDDEGKPSSARDDVGKPSSTYDDVDKPNSGYILNRKVRMGTRNFAIEEAMTKEEAVASMEAGFKLVADAKAKGYKLVCVGEMGIGNTTTSTAIACSLLGLSAEDITGRGAGLDSNGLEIKKRIIQSAIDKYGLYNSDPMTVLKTVGGFDIAAMAGAFIGGAVYGIPIVMDGVISAVAALVAERLVPGVKEYIIPSHMSGEPAMCRITDELKLTPVIDASMSLGEGTGAILMVELLNNVLEVYNHAARFDERDIEPYQHLQ